MASSGPKVATIPAGVGYVDALAAGILEAHGGTDPMALTTVTVLVPTRRAVRSLSEAFLRGSRAATLLLPAIRAIGDVDEDELTLADAAEAQADPLLDDGLALESELMGELMKSDEALERMRAYVAGGQQAGGRPRS